MMGTIRLLGRPTIEYDGVAVRSPRGRKSWALLAYLLLTERPPTRKRLAELLFADAADPLGALRWSLAELRRALGVPDILTGDPIVASLENKLIVDVLEVVDASDAARLLTVNGELLEGVDLAACPEFESWLLVERHRVAAALEARLREVAMRLVAAGRGHDAIAFAARAVDLNPFDQGNHELLVRSLAVAGDRRAALHQVAVCDDMLNRELGIEPSAALREAATAPEDRLDASRHSADAPQPWSAGAQSSCDTSPASPKTPRARSPINELPAGPAVAPGRDTATTSDAAAAAEAGVVAAADVVAEADAAAAADVLAAADVAATWDAAAAADVAATWDAAAAADVAATWDAAAAADVAATWDAAAAADVAAPPVAAGRSRPAAPELPTAGPVRTASPGTHVARLPHQDGSPRSPRAGPAPGADLSTAAQEIAAQLHREPAAARRFAAARDGSQARTVSPAPDGSPARDGSPAARELAPVGQKTPPSEERWRQAVGARAAASSQLEAGRAAIAAGAVEAGLECLRRAVSEAARSHDVALRGRALAALGGALVHAIRGRDEEGAIVLHEAIAVAQQAGDRATVVTAYRELGFVEVQAGRRATAESWLGKAQALAATGEELAAILGVRGMNSSDLADYPAALEYLGESVQLAAGQGDHRQQAWSLSLLGRAHLLRGNHSQATATIAESLELVRRQRWIAFQPWPQALQAELDLAAGRVDEATDGFEQAWALGCQLNDPCWEGMAARGLGMVSAGRGDYANAFRWLDQAAGHASREPDRYQWVHGYVLDAAASTALVRPDPDRARPVAAQLASLAARCEMRELVVRAQLHLSHLGDEQATDKARLIAAGIDNPALTHLLDQAPENALSRN
ncbi:tetratricopeptide repeat protein [Kribbella flavida]|nr:tetratricopeptide repeat protein [Kribbella flavida]